MPHEIPQSFYDELFKLLDDDPGAVLGPVIDALREKGGDVVASTAGDLRSRGRGESVLDTEEAEAYQEACDEYADELDDLQTQMMEDPRFASGDAAPGAEVEDE